MDETILHGPSSSAERPQVKKSRQILDREKNWVRQQQKKLEQQTTPKNCLSDIFKGISVFFSGYTDEKLSVWHLKQLVQSHGGRVIPFLVVKSVTHVVTTGLSGSKTEQFDYRQQNNGKQIHVVHPDWIIESCKQLKVMPESQYQILPKKKGGIADFLQASPQPTVGGTTKEAPLRMHLDHKSSRPVVGLATLFPDLKRPREPGVEPQAPPNKLRKIESPPKPIFDDINSFKPAQSSATLPITNDPTKHVQSPPKAVASPKALASVQTLPAPKSIQPISISSKPASPIHAKPVQTPPKPQPRVPVATYKSAQSPATRLPQANMKPSSQFNLQDFPKAQRLKRAPMAILDSVPPR